MPFLKNVPQKNAPMPLMSRIGTGFIQEFKEKCIFFRVLLNSVLKTETLIYDHIMIILALRAQHWTLSNFFMKQ